MTLFCRNGRSDSLVLEGRLAGGECVAVTVSDGVIARIEPAAATAARPRAGLRRSARAPALARARGRETIASGTAAAAAGGYCAILAMPNTDPVVDSAAVLGSSSRRRGARRSSRPASWPRSRRARRRGADGDGRARRRRCGRFTDDGRPVASAGLIRRALQYGASRAASSRFTARSRPSPGTARCTRGRVSAELGRPYPSVAESAMVERDLSLAGYEGRPLHLMHLSREGVGRGAARGARTRGRRDG